MEQKKLLSKMPVYKNSTKSRFSIEQLYELIIDVERYPEFLPWCTAVRILGESPHDIIADVLISFKAFSEHFRSKIISSPPKDGKARVETALISGPFKHLRSHWNLKTLKNGETKIEFFIDFEIKSALLQKIIGLVFIKACQKMISSFEKRAEGLFG